MPIKNQLQVDQSIHINIPVLHSYCELNWMAVWQFHNINQHSHLPGLNHRCHCSSQPKLQRALKYLSCLCDVTRQSLQHQPKEQVHQRTAQGGCRHPDAGLQEAPAAPPWLTAVKSQWPPSPYGRCAILEVLSRPGERAAGGDKYMAQ